MNDMNDIFKKEWELYRQKEWNKAFEAERPKEKGKFEEDVKPGEIRIFADMPRPFVALVAESRGAAGWLIVPVSPFTVPASGRELLVGERVFQLWNACTAAKSFVARSWVVDMLDAADLADIAAAVKGANPGRVRDDENAVAQYERAFLVAGGTFVPLVRPQATINGRIIFFRCLRAAAALAVCGGVAWYATRVANESRSAQTGVAYEMRAVEVNDEDIAVAVREAEDKALAEAAPRIEAAKCLADEGVAIQPQTVDAVAVVKSPVVRRNVFGSARGGEVPKAAPPAVKSVVKMASEKKVAREMLCDMAAEADASYHDDRQIVSGSVHAVPEAERYAEFTENEFLDPKSSPLSTFSLDVDTTSYALMRRAIADQKRLPPRTSVRIEEFVNYFHYDYPEPKGDDPIAVECEMADCPWNAKHKLARIGLQAKRIAKDKVPPCNLTFLIDVSGSMSWPGGIDMVKKGLSMLVG